MEKTTNFNIDSKKEGWLLKQKIDTLIWMLFIVIQLLTVFTVIRFIKGDINTAIADGFGVLIFIILHKLLKKDNKYYNSISLIFISALTLVITAGFFASDHDIIRATWFIAILTLAYYLRDAKGGLKWLIFFIAIIIVSYFLNENPNIVGYIVIISNLILISTILYFYDKIKQKEQSAILEQKNLLEQMVKDRTKELNKLNDNLEKEVKKEVHKNTIKDKMMIQQNKMAMMGEMIGNIAHQFRQPLSAISSTSSSISIDIELGIHEEKSMKNKLNNIIEYVNHLSHTINDFRNFFKEDKEKTIFNLSQSIEKDLFIIESTTINSQIEIIKDFDENIELNTFKNELTQAILNILNNSKDALVEFVEQSQKRLIFISIQDKEEKAVIIIIDNAGGIDEQIIDKIFDEKFTTKAHKDGTGIGLFMTKQMIEDHMNGDIFVSNKEFDYDGINYKGAQFKIVLDKIAKV